MADGTARFDPPLIWAARAQKKLTYNEAPVGIDRRLHAAMQSIGDTAPPASSAPDQCWIVGMNATGAWRGRAGQITGWRDGGRCFMALAVGMTGWIVDEALFACHHGWIGWLESPP
ncbi:DUF2793 domain-containing protein [Sphingomonas oleivorans]|nr:DUF2793 domain-containing protein [Sphingomonas oleivorans]